MPVAYNEQHGSPHEDQDTRGFSATRVLDCAWADRLTLVGELISTAYPAKAAAICVRIGVVPIEAEQLGIGADGVCAYERALVTAEFETPRGDGPETVETQLMSESLEPTAEFLTLDYTKFGWGPASGKQTPLTAGEAPGRLIRGCDYVVTYYGIATIDIAIFNLMDSVNLAALTAKTAGLTGLSFAAETLLYQPPTLTRVYVGPTLIPKWNVTMRLTYKPNWFAGTAWGWNWFYNAELGTMAQIYRIGASTPELLYTPTAFTALFPPGS